MKLNHFAVILFFVCASCNQNVETQNNRVNQKKIDQKDKSSKILKNKDGLQLVFKETLYIPIRNGLIPKSLGLNDSEDPCDPVVIDDISEFATLSYSSDPMNSGTDLVGFGLGGNGGGVKNAAEELMRACMRSFDNVGDVGRVVKPYLTEIAAEAKKARRKVEATIEMQAQQVAKIKDKLTKMSPEEYPQDIKDGIQKYEDIINKSNDDAIARLKARGASSMDAMAGARREFVSPEQALDYAIRHSKEMDQGVLDGLGAIRRAQESKHVEIQRFSQALEKL
jgi:hypothetical protein